jgi:hypothetical protein
VITVTSTSQAVSERTSTHYQAWRKAVSERAD